MTFLKRVWEVILESFRIFSKISGEQRAAAFAYYAFFSLFPVVLLFVTISSFFIDRQQAADQIIDYLRDYMPLEGEDQKLITGTINGVIQARGGASLIALAGLIWGSMRFFQALVRAVNRAWDVQPYNWWRLPLKNLAMIGIMASAVLVGLLAPWVLEVIRRYAWLPGELVPWLFRFAQNMIPILLIAYGLCLFYKFAPRRKTKLSEVWVAALVATLFLFLLQHGLAYYATSFGNFNAIYGTFGAIILLLMWIYLSGLVVILGGCLCAALDKCRHPPEPPSVSAPEETPK